MCASECGDSENESESKNGNPLDWLVNFLTTTKMQMTLLIRWLDLGWEKDWTLVGFWKVRFDCIDLVTQTKWRLLGTQAGLRLGFEVLSSPHKNQAPELSNLNDKLNLMQHIDIWDVLSSSNLIHLFWWKNWLSWFYIYFFMFNKVRMAKTGNVLQDTFFFSIQGWTDFIFVRRGMHLI